MGWVGIYCNLPTHCTINKYLGTGEEHYGREKRKKERKKTKRKWKS
jgi:hypothetical protein